MEHQKSSLTPIISPIHSLIKKHRAHMVLAFTFVAIFAIQIWILPTFSASIWTFFVDPTVGGRPVGLSLESSPPLRTCCGVFLEIPPRKFVAAITEFGGVGDGKMTNTEAFRKPIGYVKGFEDDGGSQLNVPKGRWITGTLNLTSNFTLFLEEGAVILGSQSGV